MTATYDLRAFYELHADDEGMPDRWFVADPRAAPSFVIDPKTLSEAEVSEAIRDELRVPVRLVDLPGMHYPITVYPDGVCELDAFEFTDGKWYEGVPPASVSLCVDGRRPEFTFGGFDMPVVSRKLGELMETLCPSGVQRFPVTVLPSTSGFEILNVTALADCLDETRSGFDRWTPEDGRPDRVGDYRDVHPLWIDPSRTGGHEIFRVRGWEMPVIVSDRVKAEMEKLDNLGVVFERVG